jgi:hypothetical protein
MTRSPPTTKTPTSKLVGVSWAICLAGYPKMAHDL